MNYYFSFISEINLFSQFYERIPSLQNGFLDKLTLRVSEFL